MSCCFGVVITEHALCEPEPTMVCADCGRTVEADVDLTAVGLDGYGDGYEHTTVADLADVPIWRYEPEPECEHGATFTGPGVITFGQDVVSEPFTVTLCLLCHHLAPTPQEDTHP